MSITRIPGLLYGGDYNAEQWPEETWLEDAQLMQEAGVNLVTVGVFSWALLEPEPDVYEFDWLDRLLDLLHTHGIAVDLATGTASPPAWLVRSHPDVLPVTADGTRLEFGSRQHYCPSSPVFRERAATLARQLAGRYREHPAVVMWHIGNEYADHTAECFCDVSARDFRDWLTTRYGSIAALNDAWGTRFWSQRYDSFDQIEPPRSTPAPPNPTQQLDWQRFCSDALLECYRAEKAVLDEMSPQLPVTTNFMGALKSLDYWKWAAEEDLVSDDAYPDPADPDSPVAIAMTYDLMRSLRGGKPWLLMESAPSAVSWREVNVPKSQERRRLDSLQALAHGSDGVMFFQWRASRSGAEKFHSAMVPHRGTRSRGWRHTVELGRDLQRLSEITGSRTEANVALVLDWDSWWALELEDHPSQRLRLKPILLDWYRTLWRRNVSVDFVPPTADLSRYRLVLAPSLYLLRDQTAQALSTYVDGGGHLAVGFFSGIVDEDDRVHPGGMSAALQSLLGVVVDEWSPIPDGDLVPVELDGRAAQAHLWSEWIEPTTATAVARYTGGPLDGRSAMTRNAHGSGSAWYAACHLDEDGLDALLGQVLSEAGVTPVLDAPHGVEVTRRTAGDGTAYLFVLNHTGDCADLTLPGPALDLLSPDSSPSEHLTLHPGEPAVLRLNSQEVPR